MNSADFLFYFGLALFIAFLAITFSAFKKFIQHRYAILLFILIYFAFETFHQFGVVMLGHERAAAGLNVALNPEIYISFPARTLIIFSALIYFSRNSLSKKIGEAEEIATKNQETQAIEQK